MKQNKTTLLLAALAFLAISCAKEAVNEEPAPEAPKASTIHVTVGAGFAQTKSAVDYADGHRTLKFTEGDQLYVRANYGNYFPAEGYDEIVYPYVIAGYLDIDATTISENGASASFSGDLTVYEVKIDHWEELVGSMDNWEWNDELQEEVYNPIPVYQDIYAYTYPDEKAVSDISGIFETDDPLGECDEAVVNLVHNNSGGEYSVDSNNRYGCYRGLFALDVTTLMTSRLRVSGYYDKDKMSFDLSTGLMIQPILNCTISGLNAGVTYEVYYSCGYERITPTHGYTDYGEVTTNNNGVATFAIIGKSENDGTYHGFKFEEKTDNSQKDVKYVDLGQKSLVQKVYNITRTASTSIPE